MDGKDNIEVNKKEYEKDYQRWQKNISSGKHVPLSAEELSHEQIKLDKHLADLELRVQSRQNDHEKNLERFNQWRNEERPKRFIPLATREMRLYNDLPIAKKVKCLLMRLGRQTLANRLKSVAAPEVWCEFENETTIETQWYDEESKEEYARLANIDRRILTYSWAGVLQSSIWTVSRKLDILNWDAIHLEQFRKRAREHQSQISALQAVRQKRKRELEFELKAKRESEAKLNWFQTKYNRSEMKVGKEDYKRGNKIDNYFMRHLRPRIISHFGLSCIKCKRTSNLQLDHWIISKNEGGNFMLFNEYTNRLLLNVAVFCSSCNASKGDQGVVEWGGIKLAEEVDGQLAELFDKLWRHDDRLRSVVMKYFELSVDEVILAINEID